ncbi:hypothetical protein SO802_002774 [Lithocarpus litseifolius]|uniref:RNase H type-1 domain-containing protein n=1 Tax=Lithocarpus litseifolius TaxID=425828 RepID=A0AAW2DY79_9ROSI
MDDLTGKWARLSLNTRETQTLPLAPEVENNNRVLVAKLFTKRRVNVEALSRTLKTMWRFIQKFEVRNLTSNTVLILFSDEADVRKILSQEPWSFDKYLIGLYKPGDLESVDDAKFDTASFWLNNMKGNWEYNQGLVVSSDGSSGGLTLLWKPGTQHVGQDLLELIITIAWCIWYNRNRTRHGSPRQSSNEIIHKARTIMEEFQVAHFTCPQPTAKAIDIAVSFAWDVGVQDVIFETDSHVIFTALLGSTMPPATVIDVIESIQHKLHVFRRVKVQHVGQQGNKSAHTLAQHAKGIHGFVTWMEESPPIIESLVLQDAMYLSLS